jgi:peptidoglycan/xylan/chitin deacetylase (PgdA/CDA1 family)
MLDPPTLLLTDSAESILQRLEGTLHPHPWAPFSFTYCFDFTEFHKPGQYSLVTADRQVRSPLFSIGAYPAWQEKVVGFIRTQRCGFNPHTGQRCHQKDGLSFFGKRPDSSYVDATGGWHDAGDQLKYLITGSNTTARLLMTYQMKPGGFIDEVNARGLPGSNGLPDILDEARWGLEWILKLHPGPGELYHQVADDRDHRGFKLPHEDNADYGWGQNNYRPVYFATGEPQGLSQYQSMATGIANLAGRSAATLALGHEVFNSIPGYEHFAEHCLEAALELYSMGRDQEGYQQGNSYGAPYRYEENTWEDDMEWAAAQLYKITGERHYLEEARHYAELIGAWSWMERDTAGHYEMYPFLNMGHYVLWQTGLPRDKKAAIAYYRQNLTSIQATAGKNPYGTGHLFIWCSNNLAAAVATQAMLYEEMTGSDEFRPLLQDHVNWLLGLNPWYTSMITGIPEFGDSPVDVHMPFWRLNGETIPGSLVDGPLWSTIHEGMLGIALAGEDEYAHLQPPHVRYHDDWMDYSTNEPTLDGSAELLMILSFLSRQDARSAQSHNDCDRFGARIRTDTAQKCTYLCFTGHEHVDGFDHTLQVLKKQGVKASFFLTGDLVRDQPGLVERILAGGHTLGPHSDRHLLYCSWEDRDSLVVTPAAIKEDIRQNLSALQRFGITPTLFMPPYEWHNRQIVSLARELGLETVNFTPGTRSNADYTTPDMPNYLSSQMIMKSIMDREETSGLNGYHLLIHPGTSPLRTDKFYLDLEKLITQLRQKGYTFDTL